MTKQGPGTVTEFLQAWQDGDNAALDELTQLVYDELRKLAAQRFRKERAHHTLQPTALVHEAFLRLLGGIAVPLRDRTHFYAIASTLMRRVLVEHARARQRIKRSGPYDTIALEDAGELGQEPQVDVIVLDDALNALAKYDVFAARVIELRYFGGLTVKETAVELGVSGWKVEETTRHAWAWLRREMGENR